MLQRGFQFVKRLLLSIYVYNIWTVRRWKYWKEVEISCFLFPREESHLVRRAWDRRRNIEGTSSMTPDNVRSLPSRRSFSCFFRPRCLSVVLLHCPYLRYHIISDTLDISTLCRWPSFDLVILAGGITYSFLFLFLSFFFLLKNLLWRLVGLFVKKKRIYYDASFNFIQRYKYY